MEAANHALRAVRLINEAYKTLKDAGEKGMDDARTKTESFPDVMYLTIGGDFRDFDAIRGGRRTKKSPFVLNTEFFKGKAVKTGYYNYNVQLNTIDSTDYVTAFKAIKQYAGTKKMLLIGEDIKPKGENAALEGGNKDEE